MVLAGSLKQGEVFWPLPEGPLEQFVAELWRPLFTVDEACPRFLYIEIKKEGGLGDQLERFFTALSLVFQNKDHNITMLTEYGSIGRESVHLASDDGSYKDIVHNVLGIPHIALNLSTVRSVFRPREIAMERFGVYGDFLTGMRNYSEIAQCNDLVIVDVYDSCQAWCPFVFSEEMELLLQPLLRETRKHSNKCHDIEAPLRKEVVNIVWHIRTGDICLHCEDRFGKYYQNIYSFILLALPAGTPHQNIIVHQADSKHYLAPQLFDGLANLTHFTSDNVTHAACNFLSADVLMLTGSSFPSMVSWFSPHFQPLVLQEKRSQADFNHHSRYPYAISPGEAFRLDDGVLVNKTKSTEEMIVEFRDALRRNGVLTRIATVN